LLYKHDIKEYINIYLHFVLVICCMFVNSCFNSKTCKHRLLKSMNSHQRRKHKTAKRLVDSW